MLKSSTKGESSGVDMYKTAVIDTLVAEVQNVPGEDRCVLLLGYTDEMTELFQHANPGFARRFPLDEAFTFDDFSLDQLLLILDLKLAQQNLGATAHAKQVAADVLSKQKRLPNFGNGGSVENLIGKAKSNQQKRVSVLPLKERPYDIVFEPQDFDPDYDRHSRADANLSELFKDVVDCDRIVQQLGRYQKVAHIMRQRGQNPEEHIPFNFLMKGPPARISQPIPLRIKLTVLRVPAKRPQHARSAKSSTIWAFLPRQMSSSALRPILSAHTLARPVPESSTSSPKPLARYSSSMKPTVSLKDNMPARQLPRLSTA